MNLYISAFEYQKAPTGQETASLLGNLLRVGTGGVALGATSLPVTPNTTVALNQYDNITIFDGSSSEVVQVTATTASGASSVPITATQYAHAVGTPLCSDGTSGSLAQAIIAGSAHVERHVEKPLLATTYTNETLRLRSMEAAITSDGTLHFRPRQWPITAVTGLSILLFTGTTLTLDPTQCIISTRAQSVDVPVISTTSGGVSVLAALPPLTQLDQAWIQVTYTAGYAYSALPYDIKQAAIWLTSDVLADRQNESGAADMRLGQKQLTMYLRGDQTGETTFVKRAYSLLDKYKRVA